jgi:hypothetical protein
VATPEAARPAFHRASVSATTRSCQLKSEEPDCWNNSGFWGSDAVYCPDAGLTIGRSVNQALDGDFDGEALERRVAEIVLG